MSLIIVIDEEAAEKFSKIAPTVLVPYGDMTQDERITFIGEVLNRQDKAAEAISTYNTTVQTKYIAEKLLSAAE